MLTGLQIIGSYDFWDLCSSGKKDPYFPKLDTYKGWSGYIQHHQKSSSSVNEKEHVAFLTMWLERFVFCGATAGPAYPYRVLAEKLAQGHSIPLGKLLLGAAYRLMNRVFSSLIIGEEVQCITDPWWLVQLWLNLYLHKLVRTQLQGLSFPSTEYSEEEDQKPEAVKAMVKLLLP